MPENNAKIIREYKHMTLKEVVETVNNKLSNASFSIDKLTRFENNDDFPNREVLNELARIYGCSVAELMGFSPIVSIPTNPIKMDDKWSAINNTKKILDSCSLKNEKRTFTSDISKTMDDEFQNCLIQLFANAMKKPVIAFVGQQNVGKTAQIKTITGKSFFNSKYTFATAAITHIKHIDDKPQCLGNNNIAIIRDNESAPWTPENACDEKWIEHNHIKYGDTELLNKYGIHTKDKNSEDKSQEVGAIIIYLDSPILKNCDLVDLPGFAPAGLYNPEGEGEKKADSRDSMLNESASKLADAYIYLSSANQFMQGQDKVVAQAILKYLNAFEKKDVNTISPLGNIFFVASHAASVNHGNIEELNKICDNKSEELWELIKDHPCIKKRNEITGYDYTYETLRNRFFTSEIESEDLTSKYHNDLKAFIEGFADAKLYELKDQLDRLCKKYKNDCDEKIKFGKNLQDNHADLKNQFKSIDINEKRKEFDKNINETKHYINDAKIDIKSYISYKYNEIINPTHILDIIEQKELKKSKKDMEVLVTTLCSELENAITERLEDKTDTVNAQIDKFLQSCEKITFDSNMHGNISSNSPLFTFNAERAFASGISGLAALGALSAWAATCGNLGGYIIIAKIVSALASVGIHVGGTAAAISAVSALGGPVVFGIAISALLATSTLLALGGTWKKSIGNKIVKQFNEKDKKDNMNVLERLTEASETYWNETLEAFEKGAKSVKDTWEADINKLKNKVENFNEEEVNNTINELNVFNDFVTEVSNTLESI